MMDILRKQTISNEKKNVFLFLMELNKAIGLKANGKQQEKNSHPHIFTKRLRAWKEIGLAYKNRHLSLRHFTSWVGYDPTESNT